MGKSVLYLDYEFNEIVEPSVNLVCCATLDADTGVKKKWWLHKDPSAKKLLAAYIKKYSIVIGYSCVAEARSFQALGLNPLDFKWLDLFLEYRQATNHNDLLQWGKQLVDGKVKSFRKPKPKWERTEEDAAFGFKATHSLAECTYKLTGEIRDTAEKTRMRDLIISNPKKFSEDEQRQIMDYCLEDVVFLPKIWKRLKEEFGKLAPDTDMEDYFLEAVNRGRYAAHTALMESTGYPINVEATRNFSKQIPNILMECQRDINAQFPEIKPFKWQKNVSKFSWNQKATRDWVIDNHNTEKWMKTDGGNISLALEAFERNYAFKHSYPQGNFGAQMVRFLKLKQSLYGFSDAGGKRKNFWDSVGSDGRVRPYLNIYGAQSSRSQPGASGFMFLKPAWMRSLVQPRKGYYIAGIDYGQQEFFLSALESEDENMIAAYLSGDPYLYGAKLAGAIPQSGTKESHKIERDLFKNTYLGILYGMTKYGLAIKLTNDTGREYTEDEAQEQIDIFEESFPKYMQWKEDLMDAYSEGCGIRLPCIAKGVKVLTKSGSISIEEVTKQDLIWDGYKWRKHGGVVRKGVKGVISDHGAVLTATPDHLVLHRNRWHAWLEVLEESRSTPAHCQIASSADGRLLASNYESKVGGMSLVAAYVELKKTLELMRCSPGPLEPVLRALNLCAPKIKDAGDLAKFLLTNIFGDAGRLATAMLNEGAKTKAAPVSNGMVLAAYDSPSSLFEISWNTLLLWMAMPDGASRWTELITTGTMSPETYESLVREKITRTEETFDIVNCGPLNRFQAGGRLVHNCGWRMWSDNDNLRSVCNVPIQGFGASVMREAVDRSVRRGCSIIFTLHDANYLEAKVGEEWKIAAMHKSMREAFQHYYEGTKYFDIARNIKLDPFAWSPNYKKDSALKIKWKDIAIEVPCSNMYIDERAGDEYEKFKNYFNKPDTDLL